MIRFWHLLEILVFFNIIVAVSFSSSWISCILSSETPAESDNLDCNTVRTRSFDANFSAISRAYQMLFENILNHQKESKFFPIKYNIFLDIYW